MSHQKFVFMPRKMKLKINKIATTSPVKPKEGKMYCMVCKLEIMPNNTPAICPNCDSRFFEEGFNDK